MVACVGKLTEETICLPLGFLQGDVRRGRSVPSVALLPREARERGLARARTCFVRRKGGAPVLQGLRHSGKGVRCRGGERARRRRRPHGRGTVLAAPLRACLHLSTRCDQRDGSAVQLLNGRRTIPPQVATCTQRNLHTASHTLVTTSSIGVAS